MPTNYTYDSYGARVQCITDDRFQHPEATPDEVRKRREANLVKDEAGRVVLSCSACKLPWTFTPSSVHEGAYRATGDCTKLRNALEGVIG